MYWTTINSFSLIGQVFVEFWCSSRWCDHHTQPILVCGLHGALHRAGHVYGGSYQGWPRKECMDLLETTHYRPLVGDRGLLHIHRIRCMGAWTPNQWQLQRPAPPSARHHLLLLLLHACFRSQLSINGGSSFPLMVLLLTIGLMVQEKRWWATSLG